ncbi:leucine-rich repeat domain-containing protein [Salinibius halmophilus]|uniref:hypothetical protein n=1 Tax=Salinibius halmophilus TaxID=1853216 RepID=UPI000E660452|nr:hypothetical protein [Salinibius halmophilus]
MEKYLLLFATAMLLIGCNHSTVEAPITDGDSQSIPLEPITDTGLQACINNTPGIPKQARYQFEYDHITALRCYQTPIYNLSGLQNFRQLEVLSLGWQYKGSQLPPTPILNNLVELRVAGSNISDLAPLRQAHRLAYLDIGWTKTTQLNELAGLTHLKHLFIDDIDRDGINPLLGLSHLEVVLGDFTDAEEQALARLPNMYLLFNGDTQVLP